MRFLCLFLLLLFFQSRSLAQNFHIIPKPMSAVPGKGVFRLLNNTPLVVDNNADVAAADFLNGYLQQHFGFALPITSGPAKNSIRLVTRQFIKAPDKDAYILQAGAAGITIEGDTHAGTFYGMQTLIQLLPVAPQKQHDFIAIPAASIKDEPRFAYRGMHLDVGRHLFPVDFIKQYIDYLAQHKMNYFHWHLTDDQGWRIEIKKYPELTRVGAWRNGTIIGHHPGSANDNQRYGGYYTQQQVQDIVEYAARRHITVVPEIEMPGHSSAAIAAYPWLSCFPEKDTEIPHHPSEKSKGAKGKQVQETWGVFKDIFCAGNDSTFVFLQDVLDEVLALFPSKYIHVGGDEAPKIHWHECMRCQQRIKAEGLKDEHELQSYFIRRIEKFLNAKGRILVGWDEILEGGLAPNAIVMSWRGEAGGIAAAREKHRVIMTPGSHVYFDHSQSQEEDSLTIGGFTPLEKVYQYEPVPKELNAEQAKYVLGAQANLWTEYISHPAKVNYMIFPRMSALSEVLWSTKATRSWTDFERRLHKQWARYQQWGANYSNAYFGIAAKVLPAPGNNGLTIRLTTKGTSGKLQYVVDGSTVLQDYMQPFTINRSAELTAIYRRNEEILDSTSIRLRFNKATGKKVTLSAPPAPNYPGDGAFTLTNGIVNEKGMAKSTEFIGYNGKPVTVLIDLGTVREFDFVKLHALAASSSWVHPPKEMTVHLSLNGTTFRRMGTAREFSGWSPDKGTLEVWSEGQKARFIKIEVKPLDKIPFGLPGAGHISWMFLDEVEVQ